MKRRQYRRHEVCSDNFLEGGFGAGIKLSESDTSHQRRQRAGGPPGWCQWRCRGEGRHGGGHGDRAAAAGLATAFGFQIAIAAHAL